MAIRKVARMGHPVLRQKARELTKDEILGVDIQRLIQDMKDTMDEYGGIGIAAPQVHESLQLALIEIPDQSERYGELSKHSLTVFINPQIKVLDSAEQGFWEGCLSVPELRGLVFRPRKVEVTYLDEKAQKQVLEAEGFLATVVQHELDHLAGVLYVDRIKDTTQFAFVEEYQKYCVPQPEDEIGELED